jgi:hypothetical protein
MPHRCRRSILRLPAACARSDALAGSLARPFANRPRMIPASSSAAAAVSAAQSMDRYRTEYGIHSPSNGSKRHSAGNIRHAYAHRSAKCTIPYNNHRIPKRTQIGMSGSASADTLAPTLAPTTSSTGGTFLTWMCVRACVHALMIVRVRREPTSYMWVRATVRASVRAVSPPGFPLLPRQCPTYARASACPLVAVRASIYISGCVCASQHARVPARLPLLCPYFHPPLLGGKPCRLRCRDCDHRHRRRCRWHVPDLRSDTRGRVAHQDAAASRFAGARLDVVEAMRDPCRILRTA